MTITGCVRRALAFSKTGLGELALLPRERPLCARLAASPLMVAAYCPGRGEWLSAAAHRCRAAAH